MRSTKVVALMGSPRESGNTSTLVQNLAAGAAQAGAVVESLNLHTMNISPCTACGHCQAEIDNTCIINDDMHDIYRLLAEADAVVFASPVYWFSISAQLKTAIDRIYAIGGGDKVVLDGKRFGVILVYADSDPFISGAVNALRMFQDMAAYLGATIAGTVYGSAWAPGEIRDDEEVMRQAFELGKRLSRTGLGAGFD